MSKGVIHYGYTIAQKHWVIHLNDDVFSSSLFQSGNVHQGNLDHCFSTLLETQTETARSAEEEKDEGNDKVEGKMGAKIEVKKDDNNGHEMKLIDSRGLVAATGGHLPRASGGNTISECSNAEDGTKSSLLADKWPLDKGEVDSIPSDSSTCGSPQIQNLLQVPQQQTR